MYELIIQNKKDIYIPAVEEGITWETEIGGTAGKLSFKAYQDGKLKIDEGNPVRLKYDKKEIFYGFIFTRKMKQDKIVDIVAYDQLRYLKNKDTYVYTNKTASEVIMMIASDFHLRVGDIANTAYKIKSRVEDNQTLLDMIQNALTLTLQNKRMLYCLYDDFGKIALKPIPKMFVDLLVDEETAQTYDFSTSIDQDTYNKIKLTYENEETGKRDIYITKDSGHINDWGVLQYFDTLKEGENGQAKADALLKLYNKKKKTLSINGVLGDFRVRAGTLLPVILDLGEEKIKNPMIVTKCKHTFKESEHTMDLTLRGGDFIA